MAATLLGKAVRTTAQQRAISPTASDLSERAWISSRAVFLLLAVAFAGLATRMFFLISQYAVNILLFGTVGVQRRHALPEALALANVQLATRTASTGLGRVIRETG